MGISTPDRTRLTVEIDKLSMQELCTCVLGESHMDQEGRTWFVEENKIAERSRWGIWYELILREEDTTTYFGFSYEVPGGESNMDFWGQFDTKVELGEMFQRTMTVYVYE